MIESMRMMMTSRSLALGCVAWAVVASLIVGCTKDAPATPALAAEDGQVAVVAPEEVDLRTIELDEVPARDALPGMWVRCAGGVLDAGERRFDACLERSQTWVDVAADRVTLVATAAHAEEIEVEGKKQRFVDGRARIEVDLRALMAGSPADEVAAETKLDVRVRIRGAAGVSDVVGVIGLETPRVIELIKDVEKTPLVFPGEGVKALPEVPTVLVLGPGGASVRAVPRVPLGAVDVVAIDRGEATTLPPCEGATEVRAMRPIALSLIERRTGKVLGERHWPAAVAACGEVAAVRYPSAEQIIAGVLEVLARAKPGAWVEPDATNEVLVPLGGKAVERLAAELRRQGGAEASGVIGPNRAAVHAFWRVAALDPNSRERDLLALIGEAVTRTALDPGANGERVMAQWPGGLAVVLEGGRIASMTFSGVDAATALRHASGVPGLIGLDLGGLVSVLGRPSTFEDSDALVVGWTIDAGAWRLTVEAEVGDGDEGGGGGEGVGAGARCTTFVVKWTRVAADPAMIARLGFDPNLLRPFDAEMISRLATFIGIGPETGKAALSKAFGRPTEVTVAAGGIESYAFGPNLGALVEAASGHVIEVWVVGAAGRDALKSKQLDDPLLVHIGRPLKEIAAAIGRPSKIGDGFVSWTVEEGPLTIYLELQCGEGPDAVCNELDVGWLKAP